MFVKTPGAILDYTIDWNDGYLESGETISTSVWAVIPDVTGGVEIDSDTNSTTTATATISGGRHSIEYLLKNTITTSESRTDARFVYVLIWGTR